MTEDADPLGDEFPLEPALDLGYAAQVFEGAHASAANAPQGID